jgi:hypothetical protein
MRVVLSRKGYDATSGGVASPIFPDGTLCSLPIPDRGPRLGDILHGESSLGPIVEQLAAKPGLADSCAHLDPDLDAEARPRQPGWRPCFGQVGAAQSHLSNQRVGEGDLFLFFGWFHEVELVGGRLSYRPQAPDLHCLFGWLQVGRIYHLSAPGVEPPPWAAEHPHVRFAGHYSSATSNNTLYVAAERLRLPGVQRPIAGGGVFAQFARCLQLTEPGRPRSTWRLPACFYPSEGAAPLSYHASPTRWAKDDTGVLLRSAARGQEFVLDCDCHPGVIDWLRGVFGAASS